MSDDSSDRAPSARYDDGVRAKRWQDDPAQRALLAEFDRLHAAFAAPPAASGLLGRLRSALHGETRAAVPGLYLYGGVGRGKTFLMDLFVASLPAHTALRRHFHVFMAEVQARLRELGERQSPLDEVAAGLAARCRVLCLDEFLVTDIGDAMILAQLLQGLFARGITLVTTSNTAPAELYADGLQRARFLPAIALLERHCQVIELRSTHDWRLRSLSQARVYLTPLGPESERALARLFADLAQGSVEEGGELPLNHRAIALRRRAEGVLWFDFAALCEGPRAVADYLALAQMRATILISGVPQFGVYDDDAARRFVQLVDAFYDHRVKLALSAAVPVTALYDGERLRAEFGRTQSRLIEMQSEDYLAAETRRDD